MVEWILLFFIFIMALVIIAGISQAVGSKEDPYVDLDGQRVLFVEPEKEQWMNELSSGLDRLRPEENVLDYGFAKYYRQVYNRSLQSHVTKTVYGVLVLTNLRFIFVQRYRKEAFGEYVYKKAITTTISLIKYADCDESMLRVGTLRTPRGRKVINIDVELETPEMASTMRKQIEELMKQYQAIKRLKKVEKKKREIVIVPLKCPKCSGELQPTFKKDVYECKFCGTTVIIKK